MNDEWTLEGKSKRPIKVWGYLVLSFILGFASWAYFYPIIVYSAVFWVGAVLMGFPVYVAAESFGSLGLNVKWLNNWPRSLRISFGVFWILFFMAIFGLVIGFLSALVVPTS